jgi:dTMP kinase
LIAAEGLDGSGKSAGLDGLARWLERKGRRVHIVGWEPSRIVARAASAPGGRQVLTPRVAALLAASEAARRIATEIQGPLARGDVVLADRYVWTAVAREIARGLDPAWVASIYRFAPRPDLILFHRQEPAAALAKALVTRRSAAGAEAVALAYGEFLARLMAAYDTLLRDRAAGPWPVATLVIDPRTAPAVRVAAIRDAIRPMVESVAA